MARLALDAGSNDPDRIGIFAKQPFKEFSAFDYDVVIAHNHPIWKYAPVCQVMIQGKSCRAKVSAVLQ